MKYYLSVLAIFKNEGHCINEWIKHYILEGVEHFYLIDNGSTDDYMISLEYTIKVDIIIDPTNHCQNKHYNKYLRKIKEETEWIMVIDLDEFMYSRKGYNTIPEYLKTIDDSIEQIGVPWKMFGSSGYIFQPSTIIDNFVYRHVFPVDKLSGIKCIVRTRKLTEINLHISSIDDISIYYDISFKEFITGIENYKQVSNESYIEDNGLHLNHYPIQSFEWYKDVKMTRGDASNPNSNNVRNVDYFNKYENTNGILDDELKRKRTIIPISLNVMPDIIVYGIGTIYIDVSDKEINLGTSFNTQFGDPVPGQKKYLIIRRNNTLIVYDEVVSKEKRNYFRPNVLKYFKTLVT